MDNNSDNRITYRLDEAAQLLGVSHWTLRKVIKQGRLKAFRLNVSKASSVLITRVELEKFIESLPPAV